MASEDPVQDLVDRAAALPAFAVHRICDLHDRRQPSGPAMQALLEQMHRIFEQLHVATSRREAHVPPHERQYVRLKVLAGVDRIHEHVRIAWLWPDPSALENLFRHLEELPSAPVLIHEKLRLDVVAEGVGPVSLD